MHIPLSRELALLVGRHEGRREPVCAQVQGALRTPAYIVDQSDSPLVRLALVIELVLDCVQVDKVAHACACVPAHVVCVHVDLSEELDHLVAVCDVLLGAGGTGSEVCDGLVLSIGLRGRHFGEGERVCDLQYTILLHTNYAAGRKRREGFAARSSDLDRDLRATVSLL